MSQEKLFVRIDVPGAIAASHIAELVTTVNPELCTMGRIIELSGDLITGASGINSVNMTTQPAATVPHPDLYGTQFPDIKATPITEEEFEALWAEAQVKYPDLR